jgi:hypothetical protein
LWTNSIGAGGTHRNRRAVTSANAMTSEVTGCWRHAASRSVFDAIAPGCYVNCGGRIRHIRKKTAGNSSQPALRLEETKKTKAEETEDDEGQEEGGRRRQRMSKRSNEENEGQRREVRRQVRRQGQRKQRGLRSGSLQSFLRSQNPGPPLVWKEATRKHYRGQGSVQSLPSPGGCPGVPSATELQPDVVDVRVFAVRPCQPAHLPELVAKPIDSLRALVVRADRDDAGVG